MSTQDHIRNGPHEDSDTHQSEAGSRGVASVPEGFEHCYADVNGIQLHYVLGGQGEPLVLMDGFPRTWYSLSAIMDVLAPHFRIIAVDYRGQGDSSKPTEGYDKKTMAKDIYELVRHLGYDRVGVAGGDMGGAVAYSFAANYPEATTRLALWEAGPFSPVMLDIISAFPKADEVNLWWYPLSQIEGLPAKLLAGRFRPLIDWAAKHLAVHPERISEEARAVYAGAYDSPEAVAAAFAAYQTFHRDVDDNASYPPLAMPTLALGGATIEFMKIMLDGKVNDIEFVQIEDTGHYVAEEQPQALADLLNKFFK